MVAGAQCGVGEGRGRKAEEGVCSRDLSTQYYPAVDHFKPRTCHFIPTIKKKASICGFRFVGSDPRLALFLLGGGIWGHSPYTSPPPPPSPPFSPPPFIRYRLLCNFINPVVALIWFVKVLCRERKIISNFVFQLGHTRLYSWKLFSPSFFLRATLVQKFFSVQLSKNKLCTIETVYCNRTTVQ